MKPFGYLLFGLFAQVCLAENLEPTYVISELSKRNGNFDVCDIQAFSDGGTTSICVATDYGKLWLTKHYDTKQNWSAVYDDNKNPNGPVKILYSDVEALLLGWVEYRYSCAAINDMQSGTSEVFSREDLIAMTIIDLTHTSLVCED
jgi:hypothetical protein